MRVLVTQWLRQTDQLYLVFSQQKMVHPFKKRPSLLHYTVTYDAAKVLQYISNSLIFKNVFGISEKNLITLMSILSGQKFQTMSLLNTNYMHIDENYCIFYIGPLLKTTRPAFHHFPLQFKRYTDQSICVITYIKRCLLETKEVRHSDGGFFVSFKPSDKTETSTIITR